MSFTRLGLTSGQTPPRPRWRWPVILGVSGGVLIISVLAFGPWLFGQPLRPQKILILANPRIHADCEVKRSLEWLERIYKPYGFNFETADSLAAVPFGKCSTNPQIIYLGPTLTTIDPAHSKYQQGCRYIGVDPDHPRFGPLTLAHEFGHHRFGDVGLPEWLAYFLNPICDHRNDLINSFGT